MNAVEVCLLVLAAAPFIAYPWLVAKPKANLNMDSDARASENVGLFKEQSMHFEQQLAAGEISRGHHSHLLSEAEQLLLQNTASSLHKQTLDGGKWMMPILLVLVIVATFWLYAAMGAAEDEKIFQLLTERADGKASAEITANRTASIVSRLEQRVLERPDNIYYWMLLGQFASDNVEMIRAAKYYRRAVDLDPENGQLLAQYAQALFFADKNQLTERVSRAISRAYLVDSENRVVLGLKGIEAFSQRQLTAAIDYWKRAQRGINVNGIESRSLQAGIDRAERESLRDAERTALISRPDRLLDSRLGNNQDAAGDRPVALRIALSIDPKIIYSTEQVVFIAIVDPDGSPMPIAARKLSVGELPLRLQLSDRDSLVGSRLLSSFSRVRVIARLSGNGSAMPQSGDWEVRSSVLELHSQKAELALQISVKRP